MTSDRCASDSQETTGPGLGADRRGRPTASSPAFRRFLVVLSAAAFAVMAMGMEVASLQEELQNARTGSTAQCTAAALADHQPLSAD